MQDSPVKKFIVDNGGNPRSGHISNEELIQAIKDIKEWYKKEAPSYYESSLQEAKSASEGEIESLCKELGVDIPSSLKILLKHFNGGLQLYDTLKTLTIGEIAGLSKKRFIAIAVDQDKNILGVQLDSSGKEESLILKDEDVNENLKTSLGGYLEGMRDKLLLKKLEYDEDMGLISVQ